MFDFHFQEFWTRIGAGGIMAYASFHAMSADTAQAWGAVLVGIIFLVAREVHSMKRQRKYEEWRQCMDQIHEERLQQALKIIYDQNDQDLMSGVKPRHPEFAPLPPEFVQMRPAEGQRPAGIDG